MQKFSSNLDEKIKNRICAGIEPSTLCAENFFAPFLKKIIYLESGQLTYTENNNFLKFPRREYIVRIPGLNRFNKQTYKECSTGATPLEPKAQRGLLVRCMGMQKLLERAADRKKSFEIYSTGPMHYPIHYRAIKISHSIKLRPKLTSF
jgi:hypothetical protein